VRSAVRIVTGTVASLAITVGSVSTASADSGTVEDKRNDVVYQGKVGGDRTSSQKSFANRTDVTRVKISHGSKNVSVKLTFADLRSADGKALRVEIAKKSITNRTGRVTPFFELEGTITEPRGIVNVYSLGDKEVCGTELDTDGDGPYTAESYIKTSVTTGKNGYYKMQVPRSCLDNESKIKVRVTVSGSTSSTRGAFLDYVSPSKFKTPAWSEWILKD